MSTEMKTCPILNAVIQPKKPLLSPNVAEMLMKIEKDFLIKALIWLDSNSTLLELIMNK